MTVDVNIFDYASVKKAADRLKDYSDEFDEKATEVCRRLAEIAKFRFIREFYRVHYDGNDDTKIDTDPIQGGYRLRASGQAVLFIEFGSGAIGGGHPDAGPYGPGTWSDGPNGKGHWQDQDGWYYAHGQKSIGNPPAAGMYWAEQEVKASVNRISDEVFA